jgi:hypothetical protein
MEASGHTKRWCFVSNYTTSHLHNINMDMAELLHIRYKPRKQKRKTLRVLGNDELGVEEKFKQATSHQSAWWLLSLLFDTEKWSSTFLRILDGQFLQDCTVSHYRRFVAFSFKARAGETRETTVASERLWNNICFQATAAKQTAKKKSLLCNKF